MERKGFAYASLGLSAGRQLNDADRQIAFDKIRWTLRNKSVKWPETGHKFKQFVSAFSQMQENIRYAE